MDWTKESASAASSSAAVLRSTPPGETPSVEARSSETPENATGAPPLGIGGSTAAAGAQRMDSPGLSTSRPARSQTLRNYALVLALIVLGGGALFWSSQRIEQLETTAARKLQGSEQRILQLEAQNRVLQDDLREIGARASVLEAKLNESLGQQAQLEQLYKAMAVESAETLLHELERGVLLALQQLQFGGAGASIAALTEFEIRLGRLREPSLAAVQRALQRDLERLRADTVNDPVQAAQRLDLMLGQLDSLRLLSEDRSGGDQRPAPVPGKTSSDASSGQVAAQAQAPNPASGLAGSETGESGWFSAERASALLNGLLRTAEQLGAGAIAAVRDLFRVTRVDRPEALLTAPEQAYFLREQLRLHLMGARLAAMWRNDTLFRTDTGRSIDLLSRYFDPQQRLVRTQIETLRQLQSMKLGLDQQALAESLAAIRSARNLREARMGR